MYGNIRTERLHSLIRNNSFMNIRPNNVQRHVLQIAKTQFRYTIWFGISEKSITRYTFLHCGGAHMYQKSQQTRHSKKIVCQNFQSFNPWKSPSCLLVISIDMSTYKILTNLKIFLEGNCAIALDICYLFTRKMLNWTWYW